MRCAKSLQSCPTLCDPWSVASVHGIDYPGKNTGVGCHFIFQGIFPIQGFNPICLHLLHLQEGSLPLVPRKQEPYIIYHHIGIRYSVSEMDCLDENPSTSFCKLVTWGKFLTSLCLNFLIYKMWIIKEPTSQDVVKWQRCIKHVLSSWGLICFVLWILTRLCLQRKGTVTCVLRFMVGLALC